MRELRSVAAWLAEGTPHQLDYVETLPNPTFRAYGQEQVSFSSNNYLALSASPRLIAAAHEGVTRYGVGNCESRLLGGNLEIYDALERKIAKLKHKESAVLFATGYLTNLGVLSSIPRTGQYARIYGYRAQGVHTYAYSSDEFNHLSIREGMRNSGAERHTYRACWRWPNVTTQWSMSTTRTAPACLARTARVRANTSASRARGSSRWAR